MKNVVEAREFLSYTVTEGPVSRFFMNVRKRPPGATMRLGISA